VDVRASHSSCCTPESAVEGLGKRQRPVTLAHTRHAYHGGVGLDSFCFYEQDGVTDKIEEALWLTHGILYTLRVSSYGSTRLGNLASLSYSASAFTPDLEREDQFKNCENMLSRISDFLSMNQFF
jgi:hypothetical protein